MALLTLSGVCFAYGNRDIIRDANLALGPQDRVGLIGANGCGKTTLLGLMAGTRHPDEGSIIRRTGLSIGLLAQEVGPPEPLPALQVALEARPQVAGGLRRLQELDSALEAGHAHDHLLNEYAELQGKLAGLGAAAFQGRVRSVLRALGLSHEQLEQPVDTMSGGEYTRVRLAAVLLGEHDLLLLDEPTNHLDLEAVEWLEEYLLGCGKPFVVVSHDRYFLDRVTNRTVEVEETRVWVGSGSYSAWLEQKKCRLEQEETAYERQQELLERMRQFVDKWRAGTRARQAASRQKKIDRITPLERPWVRRRQPSVSFGAAARTPRVVFSLQGVSKGFGGRTLFDDFSLDIERGDRLGVLGPNGSGKTTLMRLLTGEVEPDRGTVEVAREVAIATFDQHISDLDEESTVLEELLRTVEMPAPKARDFLGRFLFSGEDVFKPVKSLSGGERNRLMLARMVAANPSVLLLDEPTNHLDIYGREALEEALLGFNGTLVFITHDRRFVQRLAQRTLILGEGQVKVRLGGYGPEPEREPESAMSVAAEEEEALDWVRPLPVTPKPRPRKRKPEAPAGPDPVAELEREIAEAEERLAALEARLADPATYANGALVQALVIEHAALRQRLEGLYERWGEAG